MIRLWTLKYLDLCRVFPPCNKLGQKYGQEFALDVTEVTVGKKGVCCAYLKTEETIYEQSTGGLQTFYLFYAIPLIFVALLPGVRMGYRKV
jgi:hypothetical protein